MSWSFVMFTILRSEVIVLFIDIGGIVDRHCLNFLSIMKYLPLGVKQQTGKQYIFTDRDPL